MDAITLHYIPFNVVMTYCIFIVALPQNYVNRVFYCIISVTILRIAFFSLYTRPILCKMFAMCIFDVFDSRKLNYSRYTQEKFTDLPNFMNKHFIYMQTFTLVNENCLCNERDRPPRWSGLLNHTIQQNKRGFLPFYCSMHTCNLTHSVFLIWS